MGEHHISTDSSDENAARKQFHEGIELTLMGWIRASLTLITFGLAIAEAFSFVRTGKPRNVANTPKEYLVGAVAIGLIVLGVAGLLGSVIHGGWSLKRFEQGRITTYDRPWYVTVLVAVLLMILGLAALAAMTLP